MGSIGGASIMSVSLLDVLEEDQEDSCRGAWRGKKQGRAAIGEMGLAGEEGPEKNRSFEGWRGAKRAVGRTMVICRESVAFQYLTALSMQ